MKQTKIICAIVAAALLTGCADEAVSSATTQTTAQTTTTAETTIQTTTAATTTTATTAETTVTEATTAQTTTTSEQTTTPPVEAETPTEEAEEIRQETQTRQEMAEDTSAYTTEGVPLTTEGDLAEPAKPTANYKLPEGAQLEFTGDASTALLTELPEGCYWVPDYRAIGSTGNSFIDPAGNIWLNTKSTFLSGNRGEGYYSPDGEYHFSQSETDAAIAFNEQIRENHENGSFGDGTSNMTDQQKEDVFAAFGW